MSEEMFNRLCMSWKSLKYGVENFTETYSHIKGDYVNPTIYPKFGEAIDNLENHRFNIIRKSRQMGGSTLILTTVPIRMVTSFIEEPENILILTNKRDSGCELIDGIRRNLSILPREFFGPQYYGSPENLEREIFATNNRKEIKLPNGSRVRAVATSKDALRGFTPTWLIMDEAAFIDDAAEIFPAALTALGTGGRCTLISTPNGFDKLFHHIYTQAQLGGNQFNITDILWYENPKFNKNLVWVKDGEIIFEEDYTTESYNSKLSNGFVPTSQWYRKMCQGLNNNERMIEQELEAKFC